MTTRLVDGQWGVTYVVNTTEDADRALRGLGNILADKAKEDSKPELMADVIRIRAEQDLLLDARVATMREAGKL